MDKKCWLEKKSQVWNNLYGKERRDFFNRYDWEQR